MHAMTSVSPTMGSHSRNAHYILMVSGQVRQASWPLFEPHAYALIRLTLACGLVRDLSFLVARFPSLRYFQYSCGRRPRYAILCAKHDEYHLATQPWGPLPGARSLSLPENRVTGTSSRRRPGYEEVCIVPSSLTARKTAYLCQCIRIIHVTQQEPNTHSAAVLSIVSNVRVDHHSSYRVG